MYQITSSGLQTTIRGSNKTGLAEALSSRAFEVGAIRLVPGYMARDGTGSPDLALFVNSVALVDVAIGPEVHVVATHLSGKHRHVYRYTSGPGYTAGDAPGVPDARRPDVHAVDRSSVREMAGAPHDRTFGPGPTRFSEGDR